MTTGLVGKQSMLALYVNILNDFELCFIISFTF